MKKTIRKIYKGQVDLRDYDVEKCIKQKKHMEIVHNGQKMILSPEELTSKRVSISGEFVSQTGGKPYHLYGYVWNPQPRLL